MGSEEININEIEDAVNAALQEDVVPEVIEAEGDVEKPIEAEIEEEVQFTEKELEAKEHGWNPEGKDRDGNTLSAEEYLARKPLFNKIHNLQDKLDNQNTEFNQLKGQVDKLAEQNKQIAQAKIKEREELLDQLKTAKESALTNLDVDQVRAIDDKMETVREELAQTTNSTDTAETPSSTATSQEVSPDWEDFVKDNEWAKDTTSAMYAQSEIMAQQYFKEHGKVSDKEVYEHIATQMRDLYPHKFQKEQPRTTRVGNNNQRQPIKPAVTKKTLNDIPEDQRAIAQEVMEATGQTIDDYLATYKF